MIRIPTKRLALVSLAIAAAAHGQATTPQPRSAYATTAAPQSSTAARNYGFKVIVKNGDEVDGLVVQGIRSVAINDSGDIAFVANTRFGPAIFLNDKVVVHAGDELSGRQVIDVASPRINNAHPTAVLYWVQHQSPAECPKCMRNGIAINHELKLPGLSPIPGCGTGRLINPGTAAINDAGSYVAFVTMSDGINCWVKDGKTAAAMRTNWKTGGTHIGNFVIGSLASAGIVNLTRDGDFAFRAGPAAGTLTANYICTLHSCTAMSPEANSLTGLVLMNNRGQIAVSVDGRIDSPELYRADNYARFKFPPMHDGVQLIDRGTMTYVRRPLRFVMNDQGDLFNGTYVFNFDDAEPGARAAPSQGRWVPIDSGYESGGIPGLPPSARIADAGDFAINNRGQIARIIQFADPAAGSSVQGGRAILMATPGN